MKKIILHMNSFLNPENFSINPISLKPALTLKKNNCRSTSNVLSKTATKSSLKSAT